MRTRILEAAQELFLKKGFDNVSMRAIASRIGYSPGAIYRYFKNKKEILSVIRHEAFGEMLTQMRGQADSLSPRERLRNKMQTYFQRALKDPDMFELMFNMGPSTVALGGQWAKRPREVFDLFCADIKACQQEGLFRNADVETVVIALWSAIHGFSTLAVSQRLDALMPNLDAEKRCEDLINTLLENA